VIYLTNEPSRSVRIGRLPITLRRAGRVDMLLPDTQAGLMLVVLKSLGRSGGTPEGLARLSTQLGDRDRVLLRQVRPEIPGWLGEVVEVLLRHPG
jgi:hypothetical protein